MPQRHQMIHSLPRPAATLILTLRHRRAGFDIKKQGGFTAALLLNLRRLCGIQRQVNQQGINALRQQLIDRIGCGALRVSHGDHQVIPRRRGPLLNRRGDLRRHVDDALPEVADHRAEVALELLADGTWKGTGVLGPEALPPKPFLDLLAAPKPEGYGSPWGMEDRTPHDVLLPRSAPPNNAAGTPKDRS